MTSNDKIDATLAFVFNRDLSKVLLIKKMKPIQHAGLLNGLGGKLEAHESHIDCVIREVEEEAGLKISKSRLIDIGKMSWSNWEVSLWTCVIDTVESDDFPDSNVRWYPVSPLPKNVIENLEWLIPISLDVNKKVINKEKTFPRINIHYT